MRLWSINKWLRRVGLVLVVATDEDGVEDTELHLQRAKTYDRAAETKTPQQFKPWIDRIPNIREWLGERVVRAAEQRDETMQGEGIAKANVEVFCRGCRRFTLCLDVEDTDERRQAAQKTLTKTFRKEHTPEACSPSYPAREPYRGQPEFAIRRLDVMGFEVKP